MTDYIDELKDRILKEIQAQGDLGYYLVILHRRGNTESVAGLDPRIPKSHLYEHVIPTLADDMHQDGFTVEQIVRSFLKGDR
jgi:hypothetical protein